VEDTEVHGGENRMDPGNEGARAQGGRRYAVVQVRQIVEQVYCIEGARARGTEEILSRMA
jgi:hypothetical protein